jgi:hypothetical protein
MNAILELPPVRDLHVGFTQFASEADAARKHEGVVELDRDLQAGLKHLEAQVEESIRAVEADVESCIALNELAREEEIPTSYALAVTDLARIHAHETSTRAAAEGLLRNIAAAARGDGNEAAARVIERATRRFMTITNRYLSRLQKFHDELKARADRQTGHSIATSRWYRASMAYSDALVRVFGGAVSPALGIDIVDEVPVGVVTAYLPEAMIKDADTLVEREMEVHALVERADPALAGRVALEFRPLPHGT